MSNVIDVLTNRRSIRKYEEKAVESEKVDLILKAGLMSPSSKRCRPWHFIVVTDKEKLEALSKSRTMGSAFVCNAPLAIIVLAEENASDVWVEDATIAAILMQVEANDLGLGSCWVQVRNRMKDENTTTEDAIKELLNIPDGLKIECMISAGYKAEEKKPFDDAHILKERIHYNQF